MDNMRRFIFTNFAFLENKLLASINWFTVTEVYQLCKQPYDRSKIIAYSTTLYTSSSVNSAGRGNCVPPKLSKSPQTGETI